MIQKVPRYSRNRAIKFGMFWQKTGAEHGPGAAHQPHGGPHDGGQGGPRDPGGGRRHGGAWTRRVVVSFSQIFGKMLKRENVARFRLYRHRSLQVNMRFAAFFEIYQIMQLKILKNGKIVQILQHSQNCC